MLLSSIEELPDTLTAESSTNSPIDLTQVNVPMWGLLFPCNVHLKQFVLCQSYFKVGRSPQCDGVIEDTNINPIIKRSFSKEHFAITRNDDFGITIITDLSRCGTYLNGELIGKNNCNVLQNGDIIGIGIKKKRVYQYKAVASSDAVYLPEPLRKKYEISYVLGRGGCGEVRLAYEKIPTNSHQGRNLLIDSLFGIDGELFGDGRIKKCHITRTVKMYAIKKISKGRSTASQIHKLNHPSKIQTEIQILKFLSHPFVINMKEIVEMDDEVFLVLEYMQGGELNNRILSNVPLTEPNVKFLFYQMVLAVQFLHSKGITHRDLKPENVLLSSNDVETLIKVSDFGLSKITEEDDMMKTMCGTLQYVAPEVVDTRIAEYDKQVDVWSLGVILFYMLCKQLPFTAPDRQSLSKIIIAGNYDMDNLSWNGVSYFAKDLVKRMLTVDPRQRITISEILNHSWLAKDGAVLYRVKLLMQNQRGPDTEEHDESNENDDGDDTPPSKRFKLFSSDESS